MESEKPAAARRGAAPLPRVLGAGVVVPGVPVAAVVLSDGVPEGEATMPPSTAALTVWPLESATP